MAHACSQLTWGIRITLAQEFEASLENIAKPHLKKKAYLYIQQTGIHGLQV